MATLKNPLARAALLVLALASGGSIAAGPTSVAVSAVILSNSNCRFATNGPTALAFGTIDPSSLTPATTSIGIGFRCGGSAANATYVITSDDGLYETGANNPRMRHATILTAYLPYTLNVPGSGTVPKNTNQVFTLTGTVPVASFAAALAGAYADSVVLTIAP